MTSVRAAPGRRKKPFRLTPPDPDEDQLQASIVNLLDAILISDRVAWTHIAHGGYELSKAARGRLFRLGLHRGFPDLIVCYEPGRVLWLEVKTRTGNLSPAQRATHLHLHSMGHVVVVVRCIEDVIKALMEYNVPFRQARLDGSYLSGVPDDIKLEAPGTAAEHAERTGEAAVTP